VIAQLTVVGLGLLGGSVAKAARSYGLARRIVAVGRSPGGLQAALGDGSVDDVTTDLAEGVARADWVVLATPVATLNTVLTDVWPRLAADATITDVGSAKASIVRTAERLAADRPRAFVGSHPMAGSEQSGYTAARSDLFQGATVVVTPTERSVPDAVKRVTGFWERLGARVTALDPDVHDAHAALVSHLPHLVAYALVDAVGRGDRASLQIAGRGFKDTTRIAAAAPQVWREIFLTNRRALEGALGHFRKALADLEALVARGDADALDRRLAEIKALRDGLP
jgi:prephenate dehydrogenase